MPFKSIKYKKGFLNIFRRRLDRLLHRLHYERWTQTENRVTRGKLKWLLAGQKTSLIVNL
jgi:hypothetical protein